MPNIVMKPSLDEIQQALNQAVTTITLVTNQVYQWGQERRIPSPPEGAKPLHSRSDMIRSRARVVRQVTTDRSALKNYYRAVSENKEILKLVSALSTAINSTKSLIVKGLEQFNKYSHLWTVEQGEKMTEFLEGDPGVNDFKMEMQQFAQLEEVIVREPDTIPAGCIALSSDQLKLALCTEAKSWRICYGRTMRTKYQTVMEEVFKSIDDWTKRLSRPLNDLDDIRSVMATLKEIRENEIQTDMQLDPIEVTKRHQPVQTYRINLYSHYCHSIVVVVSLSKAATSVLHVQPLIISYILYTSLKAATLYHI